MCSYQTNNRNFSKHGNSNFICRPILRRRRNLHGRRTRRLGGRKCAKVIACVNHDANAIASHAANHPNAQHFTEDIRTLNLAPLKGHVEKERRRYPKAKVVLWASLECTNHSRAKGGTSRDADSRTLAEHLFRYIEELQPDYIHIENVVEFMEWGPLVVKIARDPETGSEYCPLEIKRDKRHRATSITPVWIPDPDKKGIHYRPLGAASPRIRLQIRAPRAQRGRLWGLHFQGAILRTIRTAQVAYGVAPANTREKPDR